MLTAAVVERHPPSHATELRLVERLEIQVLQLVHRWCVAPTPGSPVARSDTAALHPQLT